MVKCVCLPFFASVTALLLITGTITGGEKSTNAEPGLEKGQVHAGESSGEGRGNLLNDGTAAARVNGVAISRKELDRSFDAFIRQRGMDTRMITDPSRYAQVQLEVLESLIARELLWQEAKKKNFVASDGEVEKALRNVKAKLPSEDDFNLRLSQLGYTEGDYREILRRQLSVNSLVQGEIAMGISVSDGEVHGYYESNPEQFVSPERVRARHILVKVDPGAGEAIHEEAKKKVEAIHEEATGGADFPELAKKHSEGPSGPKGGDLGFFSREQMVKPFSDAAFSLEPGEISDPVQTVYGYHVIKVEEKRAPRTIEEEEVREQVRQFIHQEKVRDAVRAGVEELKSEGKVEILVGQ